MELTIRQEFDDLLPKQCIEELEQLEQSLLSGGCRDPIIYWNREGKPTLIDGHTRYALCKKHGITFSVREIQFSGDDQAKEWIIKNQTGRRNLTPTQKEGIRAVAQELINRLPDSQDDPKLSAPVKITFAEAKQAGISHDSATKLNRIAEKEPELLKDIVDKKTTLNQANRRVVADADSQDFSDCENDDDVAKKIAWGLREVIVQIGGLATKNEKYAKIETSCKAALREVCTKLESAAKL